MGDGCRARDDEPLKAGATRITFNRLISPCRAIAQRERKLFIIYHCCVELVRTLVFLKAASKSSIAFRNKMQTIKGPVTLKSSVRRSINRTAVKALAVAAPPKLNTKRSEEVIESK